MASYFCRVATLIHTMAFEEELTRLEALHDEKKYHEVFDAIKDILANSPGADNNAEILWRAARAYFDKAGELDAKKDKKTHEELITKGREYAEKSLALEPENWAANKWYAILLSCHGDYLPTKQKIQEAFKIKEHADKARELRPNDSTILHFLGRFAFTIAGIGWMERKMAAAFISNPPTMTYEEALEYFLQAEKLEENFIRNKIWIAHTYLKMGNKAEAKNWYTAVAEAKTECEADQFEVEEAKAALKKL